MADGVVRMIEALDLGRACALFALVVCVRPASAQAVEGSRPCTTDAAAEGVVRGRLASSAPDLSLELVVQLRSVEGDVRCSTRALPDGGFEIRQIPDGDHSLTVLSSLGLRPLAPVPLRLDGQTVHLVISVQREDRLAQCAEVSACSAVLSVEPVVGDEVTLERRAELLAYRLGIVLAGREWREGDEWVACIGDAAALDAVRGLFARAVAAAECRLTGEPGGPTRRLVHASSGLPARTIRVGAVSRASGDRAEVFVSFSTGPVGGEGHRCELELVDGAWRPVGCTMELVS